MQGLESGWRLLISGATSATVHFVLRGEGRLLAGGDFSSPIRSHCFCIVPPGTPHALESGDLVSREAAADDVLERIGDSLQFVAGDDDEALAVACGRARVRMPSPLHLHRPPLAQDHGRVGLSYRPDGSQGVGPPPAGERARRSVLA